MPLEKKKKNENGSENLDDELAKTKEHNKLALFKRSYDFCFQNFRCPRWYYVKKYSGTEYACRGCIWHLPKAPQYFNCSLIACSSGSHTQTEVAKMMNETVPTVWGIEQSARNHYIKKSNELDKHDRNDENESS